MAILLAASLASAAALAGDISVADAYVRMVPQGVPTTAAFMTLRNAGTTDRKLLRVDSSAAKTVELHNHINDNGVMKMRQVREIEIKAKGQAELKPGSYHVMMIDLKQVLQEGGKVPLTLSFDDGSNEKIEAIVRMPTARPLTPGTPDQRSR
ncbi:MAG: copper chaperone PCu(A)C [Rhodocyclaceae bacterium]